jgi:hypothetical protein
MHVGASGRLHEVNVICRLANAVFHVLRTEFDVDSSVTLELRRADTLNAAPDAEKSHVVVMSLMCAQLLHRLGNPRSVDDVHELFVLISALDVLLSRLLDEANVDSPSARRLREVHRQFIDVGMNLSGVLLRVGERHPDPGTGPSG